MKKHLFFLASAALVLAACSSEDDFSQESAQLTQQADQAVAFDTYTSGTTRGTGGYEGNITTDALKESEAGFGVFGYYHDGSGSTDGSYSSLSTPNFMYNQMVTWSGGWSYTPLKYWPNETTNDSQTKAAKSEHTDKLSFLAYAPYVTAGSVKSSETMPSGVPTYENFNDVTSASYGITALTNNTYTGDAWLEYKASTGLPESGVDLLWGIAPAGGLNYQSVNPDNYINKTEFLPLTDLVKPYTDQKIKFYFKHALSRIGLTVVASIDQAAAGGSLAPETKIYIEEVSLKGKFGTIGYLNLNNTTAGVANWKYDDQIETTYALKNIDSKDIINPDLKEATGTGVTTTEKPVMTYTVNPISKKTGTSPDYVPGVSYYKKESDGRASELTKDVTTSSSPNEVFKYDAATGTYTGVAASTTITLSGSGTAYYKITATTAVAPSTTLASGKKYWHVTTDGSGIVTYEPKDGDGITTAGTDDYYEDVNFTVENPDYSYTETEYYTAITPRYWMVIPTGSTDVDVTVKYKVVTTDASLNDGKSEITNEITKTESVNFENGKTYNLKLILGETSVKFDAEVSKWEVADDTEVYLPQNVE